jgi:hypothetical protein
MAPIECWQIEARIQRIGRQQARDEDSRDLKSDQVHLDGCDHEEKATLRWNNDRVKSQALTSSFNPISCVRVAG